MPFICLAFQRLMQIFAERCEEIDYFAQKERQRSKGGTIATLGSRRHTSELGTRALLHPGTSLASDMANREKHQSFRLVR